TSLGFSRARLRPKEAPKTGFVVRLAFQCVKTGIKPSKGCEPASRAKQVSNQGKMVQEEAKGDKTGDGFCPFGQTAHVIQRFMLIDRVINAAFTGEHRESEKTTASPDKGENEKCPRYG